MLKRLLFVVTLALGLAAVFFAAALAQGTNPPPVQPVTDDQVNAVAKQLYCPVCENIPLDVCPTDACKEWRALIRVKLSQGWSEKQIKDYFVQQYGDRVVGTPPTTTPLNWLAYLVPPVAILAGIFIFYRAVRAMMRPAPQAAGNPAAPPETGQTEDEYVRRLEEELKKR
jgi:cytochrome c-type biogenesis protein CcmH